MRPTTFSVSILFATAILAVILTSASAETVVINHTDRGWYTPYGIHEPNNLNYVVGDQRRFSTACPSCGDDYRNFFVFDLSSVIKPIASATLELEVPKPPGLGPGFDSPDGSETYELHDVDTPIATLVAGTGGVAAHIDLGTGVIYGVRTMTVADAGNLVQIGLNQSAVAALNTATGLFAIGGSIITLDTVANGELTFGWSGDTSVTRLRLILVPEPSTLFLLVIGAVSLLGRRIR